MSDLANKNTGYSVTFKFQISMKSCSACSMQHLGPHHLPGPSASHSPICVLEPQSKRGPAAGRQHSGPSPPPSSSQAAAGGATRGPAVCRPGGVLQRQPGWHRRRRVPGRDPGPGEPHLCSPPVWLFPEASARDRGSQETRARRERSLANPVEDPEQKMCHPRAVLQKSSAPGGRPSSWPHLFW